MRRTADYRCLRYNVRLEVEKSRLIWRESGHPVESSQHVSKDLIVPGIYSQTAFLVQLM